MQETFIPLEDAALLEGVQYDALQKRVKRKPEAYITQTKASDSGGRDQVLVALSSLSAKARKAYKASVRAIGTEPLVEKRTEAVPWYVEADLAAYRTKHEQAFLEAIALAERIRCVVEYPGKEKTAFAGQEAAALGMSLPTFYRHMQSYLEGSAWAIKLQQETGESHKHLRALALCRKPRDKGAFPSLSPEQRALIENIWYNKDFAMNRPSVELLYEKLTELCAERGLPAPPSVKTVTRYVRSLEAEPMAKSAHYLAANGLRDWKNKMQVKGKRDSSTLEVMEYVVADAHTFDLWVSYTTANGKTKAIRPMLVAWLDVKTRRILGRVLCEHSNAQTVKESFAKMCVQTGLVPLEVHIDNGRDFACHETLGQQRKLHAMEDRLREEQLLDAQDRGVYLAMGAERWSRSQPFHPWDKAIERAFCTFCERFSKTFKSYTGTLTGSQTSAKVHKDINKMLERGELLSMAQFEEALDAYCEKYERRQHRGLKDAGEQHSTPLSLWEHAPHVDNPAPPREYIAMLLMKPDKAHVSAQGITKFKTLYTAPELLHYKDKWVGLRWDVEDVSRLYVYDYDTGAKVCEAQAAELLQYGCRVSQTALEELHGRKNLQLREVREFLRQKNTPHELRLDPSGKTTAQKLALMVGNEPQQKVVALPQDREYRAEAATAQRRRKAAAGDEYLDKKADDALSRLRAMNE